MIFKHLPIFLLLVANSAYAQNGLLAANMDRSAETYIPDISQVEHVYTPVLATSFAHPRYSGDGGVRVRPFYDIDLGYAGVSGKAPGINFSGSFMFAANIGAMIFLPTQASNVSNVISISVGGTQFSVKEKYKDGNGDMRTDGLQFGVAEFPLSFTHINYGRYDGSVGYYWQLGVNTDYISRVKNGDKTITNDFNSIYFEPMISAGFTAPFVLRNVRTHRDVGSGRVMAGPFITYVATNMAKDSGVTLNGYRIGIRWAYIL